MKSYWTHVGLLCRFFRILCIFSVQSLANRWHLSHFEPVSVFARRHLAFAVAHCAHAAPHFTILISSGSSWCENRDVGNGIGSRAVKDCLLCNAACQRPTSNGTEFISMRDVMSGWLPAAARIQKSGTNGPRRLALGRPVPFGPRTGVYRKTPIRRVWPRLADRTPQLHESFTLTGMKTAAVASRRAFLARYSLARTRPERFSITASSTAFSQRTAR